MKRTFLSTRGIALPIPHLPSTATACKRLLWFLSLLLVPVLSMAQAPAIDGDPSDWPAVFSNAGITVKNFTQDSVNSSNDDIFTNGSADIDPLADWAWTQSGANDKNDIHSAGIANIGTRVYFFADRFSNNGDAAIGIWIFKNNVSKMAGGSFSGVHVNGDILLISHFVNGGTVSDRKAFVWTNGVLVEDTTLTLADFAVAVNSTSIAAPAAWGYVPKTGPAGTYPANSFFEGYIDLASANLSLDICFSSFVIETRNSQSLNASLEDLVTGTFTNRPLSQTTSGSTLCSNSPTGVVTMNGSQTGVSYQLKNASNNSNVQAAQPGTGAAMMWTGLPAGSYYIVATNIGSNCETIIGNPTVVILNAIPAAPGVTGAARCGPGIVALGASGGANCDSLIWFSDAGLTTRVNAGPTFSPNLSGTTSYWVICKSAAGCTSGATMVTGTVNSVPAAPTTTGASRCGPGIVALSASGSVNCDSLIWFSDAALTTRVNVGPGFSPNLSATTTYWVICKSVNGCVSAATTVIGTVNPIPAAPATTGASRCGAGIVALSASGGANCDSLIWFSNAGLTTRVNVGAAFSPNISSTTTYWVVCKSVNGCISAATTVVGTVNPVPAAPTTTGASRCGAGIVALSASGGANCDSLIWFSDAGLTTRVNVGAAFSPNISSTTTYWVICKSVNGCVSAATTVIGTVNPIPAAPTTTGASRCGAGVVALSASGGANCDSLIWFSNAGLTTRVNVGPGFSPNISSTTTYWVICKSVNGCVSAATTVTGTVNPVPAAPSTTGASRCGPGMVILNASGGANCDSLIWFSDAGLTVRVNTGGNFTPNLSGTTTYWVVCKSASGCVSAATTVVGTIHPVPAAPSTTGASRCGPGVVALSASGGANCDSLIWFSDAGLTTRVNVGPGFSPNISSTTTYWVVCKSAAGCVGNSTTVTGTVNPIPAAPTTTGASRCGAGVVALSASGGANCDSLIWFSNAGLTTRVNVGPNFSPNISSTTTYWVICKSVNGCVSAATTVTGTVNPVPAAPSTTGASRCGPGMVILNASGGASCDSLIWFSNAGLTTRVHVGPSFTPNLSGTTTYWVVCKSSSGCVSAAATVVGTINPIPAAPTTTGASRCDAGIVALSASGGANCDSLIWFSDAGLTTRVNVGLNFSPNVSSTTTYWVICKSAAGCSGNAATVTATVNPVPAAPQVPDVSRCGPGVLPIAASGGTNCDSLIWFSDAGLTTRVNVGASFSPNLNGTTTYWVVCKSTAGCISSATAVVASILVCGNTHCTYTQGYYGNTNGNSCDGDTTWPNPVALINHLLTTDLVIGNGGKSILIPAGSGVTVNAVMPGSKTPKALVFAGQCTISTANGSCFKNNYLTIQGKINNVLLSQTITLALNARIHNGDLLGIPIDHGYLTTQETAGCGDSSEIVPCTPVDTLVISHFLMNENVVNYLTNFDAQPATVADLLQLANDVLGGALMPGQPGANGNTVPAYADVNAAVDAINRGFDKCRAYLGYNLPLCPVPLPKLVSGTAGGELSVYPNPGDGYFTVELPGASDDVKATVLDMNGRVVYEKAWKGAMDVLKLALDDLTTGVYLLQIDTGIETYRTKIMIRR